MEYKRRVLYSVYPPQAHSLRLSNVRIFCAAARQRQVYLSLCPQRRYKSLSRLSVKKAKSKEKREKKKKI